MNSFMEKLSRGDFFKWLFGAIAGLWAILASMPVFSYLNSAAKNDDAGRTEVASLSLGKADDFLPGSSKNFKFGSIPALLLRNEAGEFFAYNAVCTHLGCTVQYSGEKEKIWCACHGGQFDPSTGTNVSGPPPKPLKKLKVAVVDGEIIVAKA